MRRWTPLLLLSLAGCTRAVQERDLFYPRRAPVYSDRIQRQNLEVPFEGGTLRGWMLRHPEARANLLYFTGNAERVNASFGRLQGLAELLAVNVLCVDYRGNGASEGTPSLGALQEDALRLFDATVPQRGSLPTLVLGYSIGTWSAVHLAAHRPVSGLVLAAPFSSFKDMIPAAQKLVPWPLRPFVRLKASEPMQRLTQPLQEMPRVKAPLLILHGDADVLMQPLCGRHMLEAATHPGKRIVWVPGAGHGDLVFTADPLAKALRAFQEEVLAAPHS